MFTPSRLVLARQRRGLSKLKVAELAKLSRESLRQYEAGEMVPSTETISALASVLGFPAEFFGAEEVELLPADSASFRALKAMTARQRDAALGSGSIALELNR